MSKFEHGLNDLANGKPFKTGGVIEKDRKPEYDKKDIESYPGKWGAYVVLKNGTQGLNEETYDTKKEVEDIIKGMWAGAIPLKDRDHDYVPVNQIQSLWPMPTQ